MAAAAGWTGTTLRRAADDDNFCDAPAWLTAAWPGSSAPAAFGHPSHIIAFAGRRFDDFASGGTDAVPGRRMFGL